MPNLFSSPDFGSQMALVCFSHLRWDFVFQRPQHLMTRFSRHMHVYFIEESIEDANSLAFLSIKKPTLDLWVITPHLKKGLSIEERNMAQQTLIEQFLIKQDCTTFITWYYTPMALNFSRQLTPVLTVYDCMDELSAFRFAPVELKDKEQELLSIADIVFTGGESLYHAKCGQHGNVHLFPSSIDKEHFSIARTQLPEPEDQINIPHPRLGFFGVLDERLDIPLLRALSEQKPDWHFVLIGPVVKIDPASLPQAHNIHYLGFKKYEQLPPYISGWDLALLLFELNESTRYISPTKTPEYLAAGKPVVSTPIHDVVSTYGKRNLVQIAGDPSSFITAVEAALQQANDSSWHQQVEDFLSLTSWNKTWRDMAELMSKELVKTASYV